MRRLALLFAFHASVPPAPPHMVSWHRMIHRGDAAVRAFAAVGWSWGGNWTSLKDYQHFSANDG